MNDVSKDIVTGGDRIVEAIHTPAATTPTLHISNPEVAKIIKESQHAMMLNSNPTIKPLMVTLNTSEQDVPSQIMESFGEQEGDSEQQLISTGNNQQVQKGMASISQANSTNKVTVSKEQHAVMSEFLSTRKTWADQCEEDEDDDFENIQDDSTDEEGQFSASSKSKDEAAKAQNQQVSNSTDSVPRRRGLSPNAPVFSPSGQQQIAAVGLKDSPNAKALSTGNMANTSSTIARYNLTPINILQALVSHDMETLKALDNPGKAVATTSKPVGIVAKIHEPGALVHGFNPTEVFGADMGHDLYEKGEEEELLDASFANVAREGDLSPRHLRSGSNKSKKKAHEKQHSWDGKVTQEVVIRQLPMRVAKQKAASPTTSTRSIRSKKKYEV